ncbi:MAG: dipeptidase PepE [Bacteroidales bacterium]|nr:dipeptidase PepE [Bacteroidales bacterium]
MNLLLISNSTMATDKEYLLWPRKHIHGFLQNNKIKKVCFVPFAGISLSGESLKKSYDVYTERVKTVFNQLGFELVSVHQVKDPSTLMANAEAIVVGGGNTFHLVAELHKTGLMKIIRDKAKTGTPFIGWSAGSNVACPTLMTTNDMPIIQPESFNTLGLIPFQINPHYLDANPKGHGGETRQQRIEEFLIVHPDIKVTGLREGCLLYLKDNTLQLIGNKSLRLFQHGEEPVELEPGADLSFLMK